MTRRASSFLLCTAGLGLLLALASPTRPGTAHSLHGSDPHLELALALGLHRGDPTLDRLLVRDLRFAGLTGSARHLASEARRLGLPTRSPSARKRLYRRLEDILLASIPEPDDRQLAAHLEAYPELMPAQEEVRLAGPDGPTDWLTPADRDPVSYTHLTLPTICSV